MHLFHQAIRDFPRDEQAKQEMTNFFYDSSVNDTTVHSLFYEKLAQNALRHKDINQLYHLRYYFSNLIKRRSAKKPRITKTRGSTDLRSDLIGTQTSLTYI